MSTIEQNADGSVRVERDCTFTHDGRAFTAGGFVQTPERLTAYLGKTDGGPERIGATGDLTTWDGRTIGRYRITSRWATPRSCMSSRQCQVYLSVDGKHYTGRSAGVGMVVNARRCK